jgi:subtilisin-like proprotein convertase family protein
MAGGVWCLSGGQGAGDRTAGRDAAEQVREVVAAGEARQHDRTVAEAEELAPSAPPARRFSDADGKGWVLALDQVARKDDEGRARIEAVEPVAESLEGLVRHLRRDGPDGGWWPVVYAEEDEGGAAVRRFVTRDLRVELGDGTAEEIAARHGLEWLESPDYAPGWAIFRAADPFDALHAQERLRAEGLAAADVLLAAERARKAMPNDPLIGQQWHLRNNAVSRTHANVEPVWGYGGSGGRRGAGLRIAIVDDGLQTAHPDFAGNIDTLNGWDWNGNDSNPNPASGDDHGTACAGVAAARGNNGLGVSGTAPEATLVGLRLIAGPATDAQEAAAMTWKNDWIAIQSNSWGPDDTGRLLEAPGPLAQAALEQAAAQGRGGLGTVFVWAGGNGGDVSDNSNYDGYANSIYTIAVAASDSQGNRAYYSERGANLVVCAPSSGSGSALDIVTTDRTGSAGYNTASTASGGDYALDFGGTSAATPAVAGIVALMLESNPQLGWRDVQEILIRSAHKIRPLDADWSSNAAGFSFHHQFGAGLVDAAAAVALAESWAKLPPASRVSSTQSGLAVLIPDSNATGITRVFDMSQSNLRVEHATLRLSIQHTARGNLEISLVSPSGMISRLAEVRPDSNDHYSNWTFSSVRHWGESSAGLWQLRIADRSTSGNSTGGTLGFCELTLHGSAGPPVNPAPSVAILSPAGGTLVSPGTVVPVLAAITDLDAAGQQGGIASAELRVNGAVVAQKTSPPWEFSWLAQTGQHALVVHATDSEGAEAASAEVRLEVANRPPVITSAALDATGQAYASTGLRVLEVQVSDPEDEETQLSWQWETSEDGETFAAAPGMTGPELPGAEELGGRLWRCRVVASDGFSASEPFRTTAVNLLYAPPPPLRAGQAFSHRSGLVLRGSGQELNRRAIFHEFSQGSVSGGTSEWVEILTLRTGGLAGCVFEDAGGTKLRFRNHPAWQSVPAGCLVVVYHGGSTKDPLLPADDADPADGRMILSSTDGGWFETTDSTWPALGNSGDALILREPGGGIVHQVAYGSSTAATPNIGSVGSGMAAFFTGTEENAAITADAWATTPATKLRRLAREVATDVFFSEYVEGSSNNKALEIYNPTTQPVDLAAGGYAIRIYANGASSPNAPLLLSGSLAPGAVRVIKHSLADPVIQADQSSGALTFNGNDAVVLIKGQGALVDRIGQIGFNPGTAWQANGVSTYDMTLRRKPSIHRGDTETFSVFDPSQQWLAFAKDDFSGLGSHQTDATNDPGDPVTPAAGVTPGQPNTEENAGFVSQVRAGGTYQPAFFSLAEGSNPPPGLVFDPLQGLLQGIVAEDTSAGDYAIHVRRENEYGERVEETYLIRILPTAGTYAEWIAGFPALGAATGVLDDPDGDGMGNLLEAFFGTRPDQPDHGTLLVPSVDHGAAILEHPVADPSPEDLRAVYEWSADLRHWHLSGESHEGNKVDLQVEPIPGRAARRVTARVLEGGSERLFLRVRVGLETTVD